MSYAFPPTAKDECLLDIYDIFGTYWEGSGNGDGSDSDDGAVPANPPPMLAIEDGVVDVEASPRASGGSSGSVPIADDGYGGLVSPRPEPVSCPVEPISSPVTSTGGARSSPPNGPEAVKKRIEEIRPGNSKKTHLLFYEVYLHLANPALAPIGIRFLSLLNLKIGSRNPCPQEGDCPSTSSTS